MTKTSAPDTLRIAIAQLNPTVGDVSGNLAKAREARADAARQGADLILYTELFISGYPPEDLVLKPAFLRACERAALDLAADTKDSGPGVIVGTPLKRPSGTHNSVIVADGGKVLAERYKIDLPNYGEFDEKRVFQAGPEVGGPVNFRSVRIGQGYTWVAPCRPAVRLPVGGRSGQGEEDLLELLHLQGLLAVRLDQALPQA